MLLAAYMVTGFLIASVYAVGMLRGRRDRYHRFGLLIPLTFAAIATPIQIVSATGSPTPSPRTSRPSWPRWRGSSTRGRGAPLSLGGIFLDDRLQYALEIPWGLSLLVDPRPRTAR